MTNPAQKEDDLFPAISEDKMGAFLESLMPSRDNVATAVRSLVESVVRETFKSSVRQVTTTVKLRGDLFEKKKLEGLFHKQFKDVVTATTCGNVMLVGPAGSGKTTLASQVAEAIGVPFYFTGAINSEFKLTGFINANGQLISTEFREAYETGGLFLFDEYDASLPAATMPFNAALSNDWMDFPDGRVDRHPDFYCLAACNTFGRGADRVYVGRNQLDAASLDRFLTIDLDYDEGLEAALSGNNEWTTHVQNVRKIIDELKIRHVVSPRASIMGSRLLAAGIPQRKVEDMVIWKGISTDARKSIQDRIKVEAKAENKTEEPAF